MKFTKISDITIIAICSIILFIQEEILLFLPNINLTIFLLMLYSRKLGSFKTSIIIFIYCLLDNIYMNSFNVIFVVFSLIGLEIIPILSNSLFKNSNKVLAISITGILFSFLYCWILIIPSVFVYKIEVVTYLISDIPFELAFAASSFVSTLLLYMPCSKVFDHYLKR